MQILANEKKLSKPLGLTQIALIVKYKELHEFIRGIKKTTILKVSKNVCTIF